MKKAAYVMFVLQLLSLYGNFSEYGILYLDVLFGRGIPFLLGNFFPTILGIIFLIRHGNNQHKNDVIYYCDTCKVTREYEGGKPRTCLNCRRQLRELPILASEWDKLPAGEKDLYLKQMQQEPRLKTPEPETKEPVRNPRDLPADGTHSLAQIFPGCGLPDSYYYSASEHAIQELRHFHSDGQSVWGYATIQKVPETIQTRKALLDFLKSSQKPAEEPRLTLCCREKQRTFQATGSSILVGRQTDCALTFAGADWQKNLSRHHARFTFRDGSWYLEDLGSMNGTKVNQVRLAPNQPVRLQPWDTIQFSSGDQLWFDLPLDDIREHTIW